MIGQSAVLDRADASSARTRTELVIDLLAGVERRLLKVAGESATEQAVQDIGAALRDLALARMNLELPAAADKRAAARIHEQAAVCVTLARGGTVEAILHDLSGGGALLECDANLAAGDRCSVKLPGLEAGVSGVVRSHRAGLVHVAFEDLSVEEVIAILKHIERRYLRY